MSDLFELDRAAQSDGGSRHKVFFALRPEPPAALAAQELGRARRRPGEWPMPRERFHVSLNHVASAPTLPTDSVDRALRAASGVSIAPFVIAFNRLGSWGGKAADRAVVLWGDEGVDGALRLHSALHSSLRAAGVARGAEPVFEPHLTLLRKARDVAQEFILPVRWWVREFVLLDSVHGEGRHEVLGRWTLGA